VSLTPITGKPRARKIAVYDLEWEPETYVLKLVGFFDGETYRSFPSIEGFLNFLMQDRYRDFWIYAHAGGLADMHFLLEKLVEKERIRASASFSGSSAIIVKVKWKNKSFTFIDSYWLLRDKLAHLSPYVGIKKDRQAWKCRSYPGCGHVGRACGSAPECGCDVGPEPLCMFYTAPPSVLRDYNERDCRILHGAIAMFQETLLDMGTELRSTIASTALGLFRTKYLRETIETSPALNDALRQSYIASRVEVVRPRLEKPARYYDINSSFPFAMTKVCPGAYLGESRRIPETESPFFALCKVSVPDMFLPPLGARGRDGRIYFPTGGWTGLFSRPDLELLLETGGRIERVEAVHLFHGFSDLAAYALDLYQRRAAAKRAGQPFLALVLKYLLNSCYGKFGEHRVKTSMEIHPFSEGCPHGGEHDVGFEGRASCVEPLFPGVILVTEEKAVPHEHVAIASYITANARRTLYDFLAPCGDDLYYCDTDSIVTGQTLPVGSELGALKLEYEIDGGRFVQPKLYELTVRGEKQVKSKGFSRLAPEQFEELVSGKEIEVERMYRVKEIARELKRFGAKGKKFWKSIRLGASRPKRQDDGRGGTVPWTYEQIHQKW
jgi:hypothetical protein